MAPKRRGFDGDFTITGSGPKRAKVGSVDVGADVFVLHSVPRTKRAFAGMHGVVCSTKGCCTVEVSFKIPRTICALYSDFLGVDGSCIVKFPCSQLDSHPEKASTTRIPFHLTAVRTDAARGAPRPEGSGVALCDGPWDCGWPDPIGVSGGFASTHVPSAWRRRQI